jgi:2-polyprenyl-3-methyl-5-hydroxy-6-metoxy-1,4-benzoquinol methylase
VKKANFNLTILFTRDQIWIKQKKLQKKNLEFMNRLANIGNIPNAPTKKKELQKFIRKEYVFGNFSIKKNDKNKHILDLGCGNGFNTLFVANLFKNNQVDGIDDAIPQIEFAKKNHSSSNLSYRAVSFQKFKTNKKYDFILISHVLQHLNMDLDLFIKKVCAILNKEGEAWIVSQRRQGMFQIIEHQKKFLQNRFLKKWKTAEDYLPEIKKMLGKKYELKTHLLPTSFKSINFKNPSNSDKFRLEFIFGLDGPLDSQSDEFNKHLAKLKITESGRINHPNEIFIIKQNHN